MNVAMNKLFYFHTGIGTDDRHRTIEQVIAFSDIELETEHDYIQWLFPTVNPSQVIPEAPTLNQDLITKLIMHPIARVNMSNAIKRMKRFYILEHRDNSRYGWWARPNHNLLRITRILQCLKQLERYDDAERLFNLFMAAAQHTGLVPELSIGYWIKP